MSTVFPLPNGCHVHTSRLFGVKLYAHYENARVKSFLLKLCDTLALFLLFQPLLSFQNLRFVGLKFLIASNLECSEGKSSEKFFCVVYSDDNVYMLGR